MFNPQNPLSAAAIFLAGIAVIAFTTLDINRTLRLNEEPLTDAQRVALDEFAKDIAQHRTESTLQRLSGEGGFWPGGGRKQ